MKISNLFTYQCIVRALLSFLPVTGSQVVTDFMLFAHRDTFLSSAITGRCKGPEENTCNCDNSKLRCKNPNNVVECPGDGSVSGTCATTVEGNPVCGLDPGEKCSRSKDCPEG